MTTIVYIDDEEILCQVFERVLRRTGAEVHTFTDPVGALEFLAGQRVDAVVCDYRMPRMTGLELLDRLEAGVPFFLVSGDLGVTERAAERVGVTGVFAKPFQPEALLKVLRDVLS